MATDLRIEADDRVGQLATLSEQLGRAGVNIDGFCATVADGRGVLHVLVEDASAARQALEGSGYSVAAEREAVVLDDVEDRPGFLGDTARRLADSNVNIEVAYLATGTRLVLVAGDVAAARQAL
ncbi:MAG TPA: hypothetical protein VFG96_10500 [Jiangellaceae bacterium]|nr:hypothetical protein [Jiangellaceae bacterium]